MMRCSVVLPAAGKGSRFSAGGVASSSKIEHALEGRACFLRAIDLFRGRPEVGQILLAVAPADVEAFSFRWGEALEFLGVTLVAGGERERWETVALALGHVESGATHVAVHDAARPATPSGVIDRVFAAAGAGAAAVIPGLAVADTLKRVSAEGRRVERQADQVDAILGLGQGGGEPMDGVRGLVDFGLGGVVETVPRAGLVGVQTPQVFEVGALREAYAAWASEPGGMAGVTDDASLLERRGVAVTVVEGDPGNVKLTRPADAAMLSAMIRYREAESKQADAVKALFGDDEDD